MRSSASATDDNTSALVGRYDAVFLDLDGVVYRGERRIEGVAETLTRVREVGKKVLFITNNSARTPKQVADRLRSFAVHSTPAEVLTSALATASMLRLQGYQGRTAFVIGEHGLRQALRQAGLQIVDGQASTADLVVVGWDRSADYGKIRTAALLVQRGARLVATNADASYPEPDGLWPGAGALLAAVTTTTGAQPLVVGKPAAPLFEAALRATGAARPLLVGDRLETDIAGASAMGWDSLLVLTGAAAAADLLRSRHLPTYVSSSLSLLLDDVPAARFREAVPADLPLLRDLLEEAGLGASSLPERLEETIVCAGPLSNGRRDRRLSPTPTGHVSGRGLTQALATASLAPMGGSALLRSVAVRKGLRGKGLGLLTIAAAVDRARRLGVRHVSLFTETAVPFFEKLGFARVSRMDLPESVRSSSQALEECSDSAVPMMLETSPGQLRPSPPPVGPIAPAE